MNLQTNSRGLSLRTKIADILEQLPFEQRKNEWERHMFVMQKQMQRKYIYNIYYLNRVGHLI
jgi:hypothetical protein